MKIYNFFFLNTVLSLENTSNQVIVFILTLCYDCGIVKVIIWTRLFLERKLNFLLAVKILALLVKTLKRSEILAKFLYPNLKNFEIGLYHYFFLADFLSNPSLNFELLLYK